TRGPACNRAPAAGAGAHRRPPGTGAGALARAVWGPPPRVGTALAACATIPAPAGCGGAARWTTADLSAVRAAAAGHAGQPARLSGAVDAAGWPPPGRGRLVASGRSRCHHAPRRTRLLGRTQCPGRGAVDLPAAPGRGCRGLVSAWHLCLRTA